MTNNDFDYLAGFNPDKVREPQTDREKKLAEAAAFADVKNAEYYNFFENDNEVTYNVRDHYPDDPPDSDGWISIHSMECAAIDKMTLMEIVTLFETHAPSDGWQKVNNPNPEDIGKD